MAEGESDILSGDWGHISQHKPAAWLSDSQAGDKELCGEWDVSALDTSTSIPFAANALPR